MHTIESEWHYISYKFVIMLVKNQNLKLIYNNICSRAQIVSGLSQSPILTKSRIFKWLNWRLNYLIGLDGRLNGYA